MSFKISVIWKSRNIFLRLRDDGCTVAVISVAPHIYHFSCFSADQLLNVPRENAKCKRGVTVRGATLRGGILAGDFKTVGIVDNQHTCVSSCCKNKRCDVALMLGKECFNVKCYSSNLCGLAPAAAIFDEVTPIITYVRGHVQKRSTGT